MSQELGIRLIVSELIYQPVSRYIWIIYQNYFSFLFSSLRDLRFSTSDANSCWLFSPIFETRCLALIKRRTARTTNKDGEENKGCKSEVKNIQLRGFVRTLPLVPAPCGFFLLSRHHFPAICFATSLSINQHSSKYFFSLYFFPIYIFTFCTKKKSNHETCLWAKWWCFQEHFLIIPLMVYFFFSLSCDELFPYFGMFLGKWFISQGYDQRI